MNTKPMKVLQIVPSTGYGGISSMIMNLYRNIDKSRVQFDFAAFNRGDLHDEICDNGGSIFYFDYIKKQGPISYINKLTRLMKDNGPYSAVHVHNGYKGGFALLAARMQGIPIRVSHIHTSNVEQRWQKIFLPLLKKLSVLNSTNFLACGQEAGIFMYGNKGFEVLTNAIDVNRFIHPNEKKIQELRKELKISIDSTIIGHVGRFSEVKNHKHLINIAERLKKLDIDFKMIFIGDGPLKEEIQQTIKDKGLSNNIILAGLRSEIPELMSIFDVYIFPSLFEGLPVSLLEAQASGLPCLVSTGVPRESDVGAGLIKFMDLDNQIKEWVEELLILSAQKRGSQELSTKQLLNNGYDIQNNIKRLMEIYQVAD
jgi:glycosyltransferase EpsF